MIELMQYNAPVTRALYRAIATHDESKLTELRAYIRTNNGEIGNADFVDIEIRAGERLLCSRHRLNVNRSHWEHNATDLDNNHSWDADGVWMPVQESQR